MLAVKLASAAAALIMSANPAGGVDMDYEGEIDIYSGSPVTSEEAADQQTVSLADGGLYNRNTHLFIYTAPDSNLTVSSSVADGMITTGSVSIDYDSGLSAVLYLDGKEVENADFKNITKTGKYVLTTAGTGVDQQLLSFTVIPKKTGAVSNYRLPLGFDLTELSVSGVKKQITDVSTVDMTQDGEYKITYHCNLTGVDYGLNVTVDHTPPTMTLEGLSDGSARGPVTVKDYSKNDRFDILLNGEKYKFPQDGIFTLPGQYVITVTDDAGNSIKESFEIKFYLNYPALFFGIIFLSVIGAAIGYMIWSRKKLRVR